MIKEKVYCDDCEYCGHHGNLNCGHPKTIKFKDTPLTRKEIYARYSTINKNNDCKYFEKKTKSKKGLGYLFLILLGINLLNELQYELMFVSYLILLYAFIWWVFD